MITPERAKHLRSIARKEEQLRDELTSEEVAHLNAVVKEITEFPAATFMREMWIDIQEILLYEVGKSPRGGRLSQFQVGHLAIRLRKGECSSPKSFYPGGLSDCGFLGWGENLHDIITQDRVTFQEMGKTTEEAGAALKQLLEKGGIRLKSSALGYQTCPFKGCQYTGFSAPCLHANETYSYTNPMTGTEEIMAGMMWHLVQDHGFCQGIWSKFRLDPRVLAQLIDSERSIV